MTPVDYRGARCNAQRLWLVYALMHRVGVLLHVRPGFACPEVDAMKVAEPNAAIETIDSFLLVVASVRHERHPVEALENKLLEMRTVLSRQP